jgi:hypothetical protein
LNSAVALTPFNSVRYRYRLGSRKRYVYITWWLERETGWVWEVEARWEEGQEQEREEVKRRSWLWLWLWRRV